MPKRKDPNVNFLYKVELDGFEVAQFTEVSGLKDTTEVVPYAEGGLNTHEHKFIGPTKYDNIVLKHGMVHDSKLLQTWRQSIITYEKPVRMEGTIIMFADDQKKTEVCRWTFKNAWPCRWEGPQLKGGGNALAIETLEIAHEGYTMKFH